MASDKEIIFQFLTILANEVKKNIQVVSGSTRDSIEVVATENEGSILAASYIRTLEDGRPPTRTGAPKGNPTLAESIKSWITAKGIIPTGISVDSLAFLIARKIHREGNLLFRSGGKSGVLSNVFTQSRIDAFAETFAGKYQSLVSSEVLKSYQV